MPPSGFSKEAVEAMGRFRESLISDLKEEVAEGKHNSLEAGIAYEIIQLKKAEKNSGSSSFKPSISRGLLPLVRMIYEEMAAVLANGGDLQEYRDEFSRELAAVHITSEGKLVHRKT